MQPEHVLQGLSLATVQVWCVIVDAEQGRYVEPISPERRAGRGVVADLQRIGGIERPHIFEIFDGEGAARERVEFVRRRCCHRRRGCEPGDAGVQGRAVLADGGGVIAVEDLALRPFGSPMGLEDCPTGRHIRGLWLIQRPHGGKDPQRLCVEGALPLR